MKKRNPKKVKFDKKKIPIPTVARGVKPVYPFEQMKIGDSFTVEPSNTSQMGGRILEYTRKRKGRKFTVRTIGKDKIRVWRIK